MGNELAFNVPKTHIISCSLWTYIRFIYVHTYSIRTDFWSFHWKSTNSFRCLVCACPYSSLDIMRCMCNTALSDNTLLANAIFICATCASVFVQATTIARSLIYDEVHLSFPCRSFVDLVLFFFSSSLFIFTLPSLLFFCRLKLKRLKSFHLRFAYDHAVLCMYVYLICVTTWRNMSNVFWQQNVQLMLYDGDSVSIDVLSVVTVDSFDQNIFFVYT